MSILYEFLHCVQFLRCLVQNIYTESHTSQDLSTKNLSSQSLPQTAVCEPKPPAWLLPPVQIETSWAAPFPSSQTPQTYHSGLRKYQRGHLSTTLSASVEKKPCHQKKEKKALQRLLPNAVNLLSTKNLHHGMTTNQCFCVWWTIVEPSARSVWPASQAARVSEKLVAHFWMSYLYYRCFHLHRSVVLCILRTTAFADFQSL